MSEELGDNTNDDLNEEVSFQEFFGVDPEEADEEELSNAVQSKLMKLDQDRMNDARKEWQFMYGFDHECSCAADVEEGRTSEVPICYLGAARDAFSNLRRVRGFLYAIATSPTKEAEILKALAAEAFHGV